MLWKCHGHDLELEQIPTLHKLAQEGNGEIEWNTLRPGHRKNWLLVVDHSDPGQMSSPAWTLVSFLPDSEVGLDNREDLV